MEKEVNRPEINEAEGTGGERVAELEARLAEKESELARMSARVIEIEEAVSGKDRDIASLTQSRHELEERLGVVNSSLAEAVADYRTLVLQTNPGVVDDLITGNTVKEVNDSLARAKALVSKVKQGLEAEVSRTRVPAGAPERRSPDLSALSPREKIQYAIGRNK